MSSSSSIGEPLNAHRGAADKTCPVCLGLEYNKIQIDPELQQSPFTTNKYIRPSELQNSATGGCELCLCIWRGAHHFYPEIFPPGPGEASEDAEPDRKFDVDAASSPDNGEDAWISLELRRGRSITLQVCRDIEDFYPRDGLKLRVELFTSACKCARDVT